MWTNVCQNKSKIKCLRMTYHIEETSFTTPFILNWTLMIKSLGVTGLTSPELLQTQKMIYFLRQVRLYRKVCHKIWASCTRFAIHQHISTSQGIFWQVEQCFRSRLWVQAHHMYILPESKCSLSSGKDVASIIQHTPSFQICKLKPIMKATDLTLINLSNKNMLKSASPQIRKQ